MRREYPDSPIAGVAAVVFLGHSVLLVRRKNEPSKGMWSLPGGVVELGERVEEALVREVEEETGIVIRPKRLLTVFDSMVSDDQGMTRYHYVLCEYLCEPLDVAICASSDVSESAWVPLKELDSLEMSPWTRRFIKRIAEQAHNVAEVT
jgi:ADP-ribose pyrophosphatase YjhB (NUDIX family)